MNETSGNSVRAILFGSTGLVGSYLLNELLESDYYTEIVVFNRKPSIDAQPKIKEVIIDFKNIDRISSLLSTHSDLYICLGTTIRKAGSIENMDHIDRELPVLIAGLASQAGVERMAVVSSIGANPASRNYYLRIKGRMEEEIAQIPFVRTIIVRPSILLGKRSESRFGESAGKAIMQILGPLLVGSLRKYRGIHARIVAKAMMKALRQGKGTSIIESEILKQIV